jgi:cyclomaltodextrinase / maltogenic alpha-amylase / neopullulanase
MNRQAIWHQAKSEFSYAYDEKTLHIVLRTAKNDFTNVELVYGDPFSWNHEAKVVTWNYHKVKMTKRYETRDFSFYFKAIEPKDLRTKYAFILHHEQKQYLFGTKQLRLLTNNESLYETYDLSEFYNFPYLNAEDLHHTPQWVKETIWYQIFMDRFHSVDQKSELNWGALPVYNHQFYGGDIKGVTKKLADLKSLGVTGIYFTPIFEAISAHKYDTTNYFKIDPQFGTNEDFKQMVDRAHALGIKVMLDGVFNHAGFEHPYFLDVIQNGENSLYKNCFYIKQFPIINFPLDLNGRPTHYKGIKLNYETFAYTPFMPKWNTHSKLTQTHLLDAVKYWIEQYDIDGWRLDVSNEMSHDFLRIIKKVSRETKKDTFILGENWDASYPWLLGDQLDSVMNYDLAHPVWKYLEHKIDLETFIDMINQYLATTPKNVMENMFNLVGTHDTIRIKRRLKDDVRRVKLAYVFMFVSSGAPNIYYGDEIGLTGEHDPDNRRCMPIESSLHDLEFKSFVEKLITLRKQYDCMSMPDYEFLSNEHLIFNKKSDNHTMLVVINNKNENCEVDFPIESYGNYCNCLTNEKFVLNGKIKLSPYECNIYLKEATI